MLETRGVLPLWWWQACGSRCSWLPRAPRDCWQAMPRPRHPTCGRCGGAGDADLYVKIAEQGYAATRDESIRPSSPVPRAGAGMGLGGSATGGGGHAGQSRVVGGGQPLHHSAGRRGGGSGHRPPSGLVPLPPAAGVRGGSGPCAGPVPERSPFHRDWGRLRGHLRRRRRRASSAGYGAAASFPQAR